MLIRPSDVTLPWRICLKASARTIVSLRRAVCALPATTTCRLLPVLISASTHSATNHQLRMKFNTPLPQPLPKECQKAAQICMSNPFLALNRLLNLP